MNPMVPVYANLIIHGLKTLEQVPTRLRLAVESYIASLNV